MVSGTGKVFSPRALNRQESCISMEKTKQKATTQSDIKVKKKKREKSNPTDTCIKKKLRV